MKQIRTGTKISLLFSLFTFVIIFLLLTLINIYTTFNWYKSEQAEITLKINQQFEEILEEKNFETQKNKLISELKEKWWFIWENKKYKHIIYDLYSLWNFQYFLFYKDTKFWKITIPYNATPYIENQFYLIYISLIWWIIFTFLSFFISKFLFIRFALKDVFIITKKLKNIDLENIKNIDNTLQKQDEIYTIIESINTFLTLIDQNTTNLKNFNSQVAHEFKTPLMVISSQIEYAQITKKYEESFIKIEKQVDLLNELLETFLFISKIQNGKILLKRKDVNVSNLIHEIVSQFEGIYASKHISVIKNIQENIFFITDEKLLLLVIKNLVDNAFKYTNNAGKIEIIFNENNFIITDNGIWISPEVIDNIFDNFYRESHDENWYGIGLNIVKKIIDILDYSITIKSEKWFGSEFIIYFNK